MMKNPPAGQRTKFAFRPDCKKCTQAFEFGVFSEVVNDRYLNGLGAFVAVNGADADSTAAFDNLTVTVK